MASDMLEHQLLDLIDSGLWNDEKTAIVPSKMDDFIEECMREGVSRYLARYSALKCSHNHDTNHDTIDFSPLGKLIIEVLGYGSFSQGVIALALELLGIKNLINNLNGGVSTLPFTLKHHILYVENHT